MNVNELIKTTAVNFEAVNLILEKEDIDLDFLSELTSGVIHTNDFSSLALTYIDHHNLQYIGSPLEEINKQGLDFLKKIIEPNNFVQSLYNLNQWKDRKDRDAASIIFQHYRFQDKEDYKWMMTTFKYNTRLNQFFCIDFDLKKLEMYTHKFKRVIEEDTFKTNNYQRFHTLTQREKEVLRLVALGQTNKEISDILYVSSDTIRTHRNNIWHKLEIKNLVGAIKFAQAFDLI